MTKNLLLAAVVFMTVLPAIAQTDSEQLQKGIFAQDSQGNLDSAIAIYRQLAYSGLTQRNVAAEAQYRLAQALLAKGDITAATREFERMERDFADYQKLVSSLAARKRGPSAPAEGAGSEVDALLREARTLRFDTGVSVSFRGKVTQSRWSASEVIIVVDAGAQKYLVQLTSPQVFIAQGGDRKATFKLGEEVVVQALRPSPAGLAMNDMEVVQANLVSAVDGRVLFDWSKVPK